MDETKIYIYDCQSCEEQVKCIYPHLPSNKWLCAPCLEKIDYPYYRIVKEAEAEHRTWKSIQAAKIRARSQ